VPKTSFVSSHSIQATMSTCSNAIVLSRGVTRRSSKRHRLLASGRTWTDPDSWYQGLLYAFINGENTG